MKMKSERNVNRKSAKNDEAKAANGTAALNLDGT